jgi:hypothetical protein
MSEPVATVNQQKTFLKFCIVIDGGMYADGHFKSVAKQHYATNCSIITEC